jgi:outer membrane receptor protein involved in Fe transport
MLFPHCMKFYVQALGFLVMAMGLFAETKSGALPGTATAANLSVFEGPGLTIYGRALPPQVSERVVSGKEARQMPGAEGDVVRALGALPGAVTPNDYLANLLVRGSGFNDNLILIDGIPAAYPFHFGGLESIFHPGLLSSVIFMPGAFDARFGDALGGILDLHTKNAEPGLNGDLGSSLIQMEGLLSLGLGPDDEPNRWQAVGAYRRGNLDLVLPPSSTFVSLPRWEDYHGQVRGALLGGQLRLMAFGSQDSMAVQGGAIAADSQYANSFNTQGLDWTLRSQGCLLSARAWANQAHQWVDLGGGLQLQADPYGMGSRLELGATLFEEHAVNAGAEYQETRTYVSGHFPRVPLEFGTNIVFNDLPVSSINAWGSKGVTGIWLQDRWRLLQPLFVTFGVRYDHVDRTRESNVSPRWSLEWRPWEATLFNMAVGDYYESPAPLETVAEWDSAFLGSAFVKSYTLGAHQKWRRCDLGFEAYHKDFGKSIPQQTLNIGDAGSLSFNALDTGWAQGVESMLRVDRFGPFSGWLSYARSEDMRIYDGTRMAPSDFSQPHVGNIVLNTSLPWDVTLGERYRIASGIPYTPITERVYVEQAGAWVPTFGEKNSQRLPPYQRLDVRLEKRWLSAESWWRVIIVYVDVINVLGTENVTSVAYNDDYSDIIRIKQFPRLFIGGVNLQF